MLQRRTLTNGVERREHRGASRGLRGPQKLRNLCAEARKCRGVELRRCLSSGLPNAAATPTVTALPTAVARRAAGCLRMRSARLSLRGAPPATYSLPAAV